ncbi:MAG: NnrS family protein, partial [Methyloceanibacter sp.]
MPLFSCGFRPFFLGGAVWALLSITLWLGSLAGLWQLAPNYGALAWHAHEMLFGYASAVVAGFLLTA